MSEVAIGIDLGTSNSAVAVLRNGKVEVLANAYGESIMASAVAFREDGTVLVGNEAKANAVVDPEATVTSAKRLIGRYFFSEEVKKAQAICPYQIVEGPEHSVRVQVREEVLSLPEISAMILRELKSVAEAQLGHEVTQAVITVPAYFNDNQRQATKDAGKIAGLEVLRILNEPTAAALAYGFGQGLSQKVAVWDLGGGTFDISVLEIGEDVFEVISTSGDTFLGGDDFDDRLIDLLADEFLQEHGKNLRQDKQTFERLKKAAEDAKKALSLDEEVQIRIEDIATAEDGTSIALERTLTANDFAKLTHDLIQRTFKVTDEALQEAGIVARELDGIVLVGGPTRLPMIRDAVKTYFGLEPKTDVDPDVVVAMGAAIHASELVAPQQNAFLLDVTPLSLQVGVAGGICEPIIERNTPVPIEQARSFTTVQDAQEEVVIRVYQGEEKQAEDNELLGQFEFSGFPKARRGEVEIQVIFAINSDGIVHVTAREPETGQEASTRITLSSGLSDEELQSILAENPTARVKTEIVAKGEEQAMPANEGPVAGAAASVAAAAAPSVADAEPPAAEPAADDEPVDEPPPAIQEPEPPIAAEPAEPEPPIAPEPQAEAPVAADAVPQVPDVDLDELEVDEGDLPELEIDSLEDEIELPDIDVASDDRNEVSAVEVVGEVTLSQDDVLEAEPVSPAPSQPAQAEPTQADAPAGKDSLFEAVGTDLLSDDEDDEDIELA